MKREVFDKIVEARIEDIRFMLVQKGLEYQRGEDVLHNFERGSQISGETREKVIWNFTLKHLISLLDILDDIEKGDLPTEDLLASKIEDLVNYLILMEASIKEKNMAQTVKELLKDLQEIIALKPEAADYPIIYSIDDEGNSYHKINNNAGLAQADDVNSYYVDIDGFYNGDDEDEIKIENCNCVIIN